LDETCIHARAHHGFEHLAKDVAIAKAAVTINREGRMIRYLVIEFEATEPTVTEMELHLLAQLPFKADPVTVADNEHPDHQLRGDRRPPDVAIERGQLLAKIDQHPRDDGIEAGEKMIRWNVFFKVEEVELLALIDRLTTHHDRPRR